MIDRSAKDNGRARRLLVTLVITTAAAAVTAGVALKKRPHADAVAPPALAGGVAAATVPGRTGAVQWRDPWARPAAQPSSMQAAPVAATPSDPSLPSAGEALQRPADAEGESTPTF